MTTIRIGKYSFQSYLKPGRHYASRKLTKLTTVAIRATKILPQWELIPISRSFQSYQDPNNFKSRHSCSFQSYLTLGRRHASRQLLELTILASRATKILSTVGVDIPADRSFQSYRNPGNSGS